MFQMSMGFDRHQAPVAEQPTIALRPYQEEALQHITDGIERGVRKQLGVAATGLGKGLAVGTTVLKADGSWCPVEHLEVGDFVVGGDGQPTKVEGVFHRGEQPCFEVATDDGASVVVDADHLWTVATDYDINRGKPWRTLETADLYRRGTVSPEGRRRWRLPIVAPIEFGPQPDLPIDPYVLGVIIGDGSITQGSVKFTPGDDWIASKVESLLPEGFSLAVGDYQNRATNYTIKDELASPRNPNRMKSALVDLGLWGLPSVEKFIPERYLTASIADRRALLVALMDCDGWVGSSTVQFTTSSSTLALDVRRLAESLGVIVRVSSKIPTYAHNGKKRLGARAFALNLRGGDCLFTLPRKASLWGGRKHLGTTRKIKAIIPMTPRETVCIKVSAEDGLFVTEGHIVTHNTIMFSALAQRMNVPTLVLAHRDELISQAADKMLQVWPGADIGVVKAERNEVDHQVVIASVQTLARERRRYQIPADKFGLVIVDEAHHAKAISYTNIIEHLRAGHEDGPLLVGVTATPDRGDGKGLIDVFDEIIFTYDMLWGIRSGYLSDLRGMRVTLNADFSKVKKVRGDYDSGQSGQMLHDADAPAMIADAWVKYASDRKTLVFTPTVATALEVEAEMVKRGVVAAMVSGETPIDERRNILARYAAGEIRVVANCAVLCLDEQTEILTSSGWVGIDEMTDRHEVANWDNGSVFFECPKEVVVRPLGQSESMYSLSTVKHDVRVTGGHRMLYRSAPHLGWRKAPVEELVGRSAEIPTTGHADPFDVCPGKPSVLTPNQRKRRVQANAYNLRKNEGFDFESSAIEAERRLESRSLSYTHPAKVSLDECRFVGFWLGDGSKNHLIRGGVEYTASQAVVYPRIIEWFDAVIDRCGLDAVRKEHLNDASPHVRWSFPRGTGGGSQARRGVFHFEYLLDKAGSEFLWGLDEDQFDALIEGLWYADGDHRLVEGGRPNSFSIHGSNRGLFDLLQAIGSVRGWTVGMSDNGSPKKPHHAQMMRLSFSRRSTHSIGGDLSLNGFVRETIWRSERAWCVRTTTKNIITRRSGRVTVMGNTEGFDDPSTSCIVVARPTKSRALYCFDSETEVLTPNGWVKGNSIGEGTTIAAFDPLDGSVKWEDTLAHIDRGLLPEERMMELRSPSIDLRMTNTHRMVWRHRFGRDHTKSEWMFSPAGELAERTDSWELPVAGVQNTLGVPLTDAEISFLGWVQSDGCVNRSNGAIHISQQRPEQITHIERTLTACGFKWRFSVDAAATNYGPRRSPLHAYRVSRGAPRGEDTHLRGWGDLSPWIAKADPGAWDRLEELDVHQFEVLLDAWHQGDGSKQEGQSWTRRSYHIAIKDEWVAGWLQSMCLRRGWKANVAKQADLWMVHCKKGAYRSVAGASRSDRPRIIDSAHIQGERVWCVSVPSGALVVRRNGKAAIAGNTQIIGRGTRRHPGKTDCLVMDVVGASAEHSLVTVPSLFGIKKEDPFEKAEMTVAAAMDEQVEEEVKRGELKAAEADLFRKVLESPMAWITYNNAMAQTCYQIGLGDREKGNVVIEPIPIDLSDGDAGPRRHHVYLQWEYGYVPIEPGVETRPDGSGFRTLITNVDLEMAQGVGEDFVRKNGAAALTDRNAAWRKNPPTTKQIGAAEKWRLPVDASWTAGELSDALSAHIAAKKARTRNRPAWAGKRGNR